MIRVSGACLGLFAFAVTILAGLAAGNSAAAILSRALWAMGAFFLLGCALGYIALRVIDEHAIRRHRDLFSTPESDDASPKDAGDEPSDKPATAAVAQGRR